jgi:hypothetical protein
MNKYKLLQQLSLSSQILLGSFVCLIYFITVAIINFYKFNYIIIGVIGELISIPFILLTVTLLLYSIWALTTKKMQPNLKIVVALLIQISCIIFIVT